MEIKIYTLSSTREPNNVRYVGKTKQSLKRRLNGHLCDAKKAKSEGQFTIIIGLIKNFLRATLL